MKKENKKENKIFKGGIVLADLPSVKMKKRANLIIMIGTLLFAAMVVANLFKIMVLDSQFYQDKADANQFADMSIPANRGSIYSSDGKILAQSATVFRICLDPSLYLEHDEENKAIMIEYLSKALNISPEKITKAMDANTQYEIIAYQIEKPLKNEIMEFATKNDIKSIFEEEDTKRYYPQDNLAASVIGFTNFDGEGQYGVEASYDEYLAGVDGVIISAKDAFGDQMPYRHSKLYEAKDGNSIVLTIDTMIQYYVESALNSAVEKSNAQNRGCAIAMNAKTGAILAMATSPGYDLNNKSVLSEEDKAKIAASPKEKQNEEEIKAMMAMWRNKAISETYEPGSVFKVFTSAAALEEKTLSFNDTFECNGGYNVKGTRIKCWSPSGHKEKSQVFMDALKNSCNPAFIQIGLKLGSEKFSYYADSFGLREKTGIDLPGEENSIFIPLNGGESLQNEVNLASSAFGQTNKLTPIQMITGYAAAINGGCLVTPYVVDKIIDSDGNTVKATEPTIKRQVISEDTSAKMREALQYVVDNNGGSNAYIMGYKIGGKSGTSEKLSDYNNACNLVKQQRKDNPSLVIPDAVEQYVGSYCCFAPANDPEIILLVMIDEPQGEYYGSQVAVPCAREILTNVLPYLGYYPEYTEKEKEILNISVPYVEEMPINDAKAEIEEKGFVADIRGEGTNVVAQVPAFTKSMPAKSKVILYTTIDYQQDEIIMPDLIGMKIKDANEMLTNKGLNCKIDGSRNENAIVVKQSSTANEPVTEGEIITIELAINDQTG